MVLQGARGKARPDTNGNPNALVHVSLTALDSFLSWEHPIGCSPMARLLCYALICPPYMTLLSCLSLVGNPRVLETCIALRRATAKCLTLRFAHVDRRYLSGAASKSGQVATRDSMTPSVCTLRRLRAAADDKVDHGMT
jgi:hypothetical protein